MDKDARIVALQKENDHLRDRIALLEGNHFEQEILFPIEWRLTGKEAQIMGILLKRERPNLEAFMSILYGALAAADDAPDEKIIDVLICKMRQKLEPFDIQIETLWGAGYYLTSFTKKKIKALVAGKSPPEPEIKNKRLPKFRKFVPEYLAHSICANPLKKCVQIHIGEERYELPPDIAENMAKKIYNGKANIKGGFEVKGVDAHKKKIIISGLHSEAIEYANRLRRHAEMARNGSTA